jgi:hypothetical protein
VTSPADPYHQLGKLMERIAALESQQGTLMRALNRSGQRATVQAAPSGGMVNVTMAGTGTVKSVPYLGTGFYTPSIGHGGVVVDLGDTVLFIPVSAYLTA